MSWKTIFEDEHVSIVVDESNRIVMLEASSGGYRPRYVTLQLDASRLEVIIEALQSARAALGEA